MEILKRLSPMRSPRAWRPVAGAVGVCALLLTGRGKGIDDAAPNRSAALVDALTARGLACTEDDVAWITGPHGVSGAMLGGARALIRASSHGEPTDLYLVGARLSPEGALLEVGDEWNVTRTTGVDEGRPIAHGTLVAFATTIDGLATGVHILDLAGRASSTYTEFTRVQRWQTSLGNLQQTGQTTGVVHDAYALDPVAARVELAWRDDGMLTANADGRAIVIDPEKREAVDGAGWVRPVPDQRARPGNLVTWTVDRVRGMEWFGEESMQYVKAIAFTGLDFVLRQKTRFLGDDTAKEVAEDLGSLDNGQAHVSFTDPEIGWPPAPMRPIVQPALPGEGLWIALDRDQFITKLPGAPTAFVTSFVRADKARPQTRVYVTLWDPRQIALHMQAGTVEPVSASGEAGPGVIPRTPEVIRRVVAGFNGGFQAVHGEYGMQADGVLYLPPKPYAATIFELRDGTTGFGSWPGTSDVPDDVLSYRQNLTAIVEHGEFNPWKREWWGGTPKGWKDNIHTTRSGTCLTKEKFVGYFYGVDLSADVLANAMIAGGCTYGVHLDMNPGLAGFEFYDVQPAASYQPLGRKLQEDWEAEGTVRDLPEFKFRARRMIKGMQHMNFPQYIQRDGRDFFYLTQRPVLPGAELVTAGSANANANAKDKEPGEGEWRTKGLPQHGFPYAVAVTALRPDASQPKAKVRVLRVDPRTVIPAGGAGTTVDTPTVVTFVAPRSSHAPLQAWLASGVFLVGSQAPGDGATTIADGVAVTSPLADKARAAVGVQDEDGMLEWLELAPDVTPSAATAKMLDALLARNGCSSRMMVTGDPHALLGGTVDLAGEAPEPVRGDAVTATTSARLVRALAPGAEAYFATTPVVSPAVWQPLQSQRVRYFRKPPKRSASATPSAPVTPTNGAAPAPAPDGPAAPAPVPAPAPSGHAAPTGGGPAHPAPAVPATPRAAPPAPPAHAAPAPGTPAPKPH